MTVRLYGTLYRHCPDYDHGAGVILSLPNGSTLQDVTNLLGINKKQVGMVLMGSSQIQMDDDLKDRASVKIFQPIFGG